MEGSPVGIREGWPEGDIVVVGRLDGILVVGNAEGMVLS